MEIAREEASWRGSMGASSAHPRSPSRAAEARRSDRTGDRQRHRQCGERGGARPQPRERARRAPARSQGRIRGGPAGRGAAARAGARGRGKPVTLPTLLVRLKETEQQQEIVQADARLISPAQPPDAPSSPSPKLFAMVGFTASLVLGSMLALLLEQRHTLRSGRQVEELLRPALARAGAPGRRPSPDARLHRHMIDHRSPRTPRRCTRSTPRSASLRPGSRRAPPSSSPRPCPAKARRRSPSLAVFAVQLGRKALLVDLTSAAPPSHGRSGPGRPRMHWRCSPAPSPSRTVVRDLQRGAPAGRWRRPREPDHPPDVRASATCARRGSSMTT